MLGLSGDERAHVAPTGSVTGPQADRALLDLGDQFVADLTDGEHC